MFVFQQKSIMKYNFIIFQISFQKQYENNRNKSQFLLLFKSPSDCQRSKKLKRTKLNQFLLHQQFEYSFHSPQNTSQKLKNKHKKKQKKEKFNQANIGDLDQGIKKTKKGILIIFIPFCLKQYKTIGVNNISCYQYNQRLAKQLFQIYLNFKSTNHEYIFSKQFDKQKFTNKEVQKQIILRFCRRIQIIIMGFKIAMLDDESHEQKREQDQDSSESSSKSVSKENAQYYQYYENLIADMLSKNISAGDKLALALILTRGCKPTLTKNRDLAFIDIDKMISVKNKTLKEEDIRMQNMKIAADLSGIKNSLFSQRSEETVNAEDESNRPQIFRLIRAAQIHYLTAARQQINGSNENDRTNTNLTNNDND